MNKSLMLLFGLLIISRLIGLPTNFSPMLAVAIFMPRLTSRKSIQSFLPAGVMLLTSIFLPPVDLLILFCIIFIFLITPIVSRQINNLVYWCILLVKYCFVYTISKNFQPHLQFCYLHKYVLCSSPKIHLPFLF